DFCNFVRAVMQLRRTQPVFQRRKFFQGRAIHGKDVHDITWFESSGQGNRTGSENLTLAIPSPHSIPWHHGNPAGITTRGVGMDPTRGASLYSGAGSACGDLDIHGPRVTGAGRHVAGTAAPDVTQFFPPPIDRPATASTSTSPTGSTPSWRSTGPSWLYAHPDTCGRRR